jgi:hypothetical protein
MSLAQPGSSVSRYNCAHITTVTHRSGQVRSSQWRYDAPSYPPTLLPTLTSGGHEWPCLLPFSACFHLLLQHKHKHKHKHKHEHTPVSWTIHDSHTSTCAHTRCHTYTQRDTETQRQHRHCQTETTQTDRLTDRLTHSFCASLYSSARSCCWCSRSSLGSAPPLSWQRLAIWRAASSCSGRDRALLPPPRLDSRQPAEEKE